MPDVIGRESATATQILQNRGFEVDIVNVENPQVERNTVAAGSAAEHAGPRRLDGDDQRVDRPRGGHGAHRRRLLTDEAEAQLSDAGFETGSSASSRTGSSAAG